MKKKFAPETSRASIWPKKDLMPRKKWKMDLILPLAGKACKEITACPCLKENRAQLQDIHVARPRGIAS
ncbi:MAG: hypothetical protein M0Z48_07635 [Nitrospiraceae bacterium]|nr:hypothetical protein [Nitrospiraceae bacterium]